MLSRDFCCVMRQRTKYKPMEVALLVALMSKSTFEESTWSRGTESIQDRNIINVPLSCNTSTHMYSCRTFRENVQNCWTILLPSYHAWLAYGPFSQSFCISNSFTWVSRIWKQWPLLYIGGHIGGCWISVISLRRQAYMPSLALYLPSASILS